MSQVPQIYREKGIAVDRETKENSERRIKSMESISAYSLLCGNALEVLKNLPSESVQCIITSPPYY